MLSEFFLNIQYLYLEIDGQGTTPSQDPNKYDMIAEFFSLKR